MSWHPALLAILLVFCAPRPAFADTDCTLVRAVVDYVGKQVPSSSLPIFIVEEKMVGFADAPESCGVPRVLPRRPDAGAALKVELVRMVDGAISLTVFQADNGFRILADGVIRTADAGWRVGDREPGMSFSEWGAYLRDGGRDGRPDCGLIRAIVEYVERELPGSTQPILVTEKNGDGSVSRLRMCGLPRAIADRPSSGRLLRMSLVRRLDGSFGFLLEEGDAQQTNKPLGFMSSGTARSTKTGWTLGNEGGGRDGGPDR